MLSIVSPRSAIKIDPTSRDAKQQQLLDQLLKEHRVVTVFKPSEYYELFGVNRQVMVTKTIIVKQLLDFKTDREYFVLPEKPFSYGGFGRLFSINGIIKYHFDTAGFIFHKTNEVFGNHWVMKEFGERCPISSNGIRNTLGVSAIADEFDLMRKVYQDVGVFFFGDRSRCYIMQPRLGNLELYHLLSWDLYSKDSIYALDHLQRLELCVLLARSIKPLHAMRLVHADIRPENIMLDIEFNEVGQLTLNNARLIDFGLTKAFEEPNVISKRYNATYMPREIFDPDYQFEASFDIYSLARVYHVVFALLRGHDSSIQFQGLENEDVDAIKSLLRSMVVANKRDRHSLREVESFFVSLLTKYKPNSRLLCTNTPQVIGQLYPPKNVTFFQDMEKASQLNLSFFKHKRNGHLNDEQFKVLLDKSWQLYEGVKNTAINQTYRDRVRDCTSLFEFISLIMDNISDRGIFSHCSLICCLFEQAKKDGVFTALLKVLMIDQIDVALLRMESHSSKRHRLLETSCLSYTTEADEERDYLLQQLDRYYDYEQQRRRLDF